MRRLWERITTANTVTVTYFAGQSLPTGVPLGFDFTRPATDYAATAIQKRHRLLLR